MPIFIDWFNGILNVHAIDIFAAYLSMKPLLLVQESGLLTPKQIMSLTSIFMLGSWHLSDS